jgi:hypothetical protein
VPPCSLMDVCHCSAVKNCLLLQDKSVRTTWYNMAWIEHDSPSCIRITFLDAGLTHLPWRWGQYDISTARVGSISNILTCVQELPNTNQLTESGFTEVFVSLLSPSRSKPIQYPHIGHNSLLLHPFQFISHYSSCHWTICSVRYWRHVPDYSQ